MKKQFFQLVLYHSASVRKTDRDREELTNRQDMV